MRLTMRQIGARVVAGALALATAAGCGDSAPGRVPSGPDPLPGPREIPGTYVVDVDLERNTVTATPVSGPAAGDGAAPMIYGLASQIRYVFTPPGIPSPAAAPNGDIVWSTGVRIENLLPNVVGSHAALGAMSAADVAGVFVYVLRGPTVTAGCVDDGVTCRAYVENADGAFPFTGAARLPYWYWRLALPATDGQSGGPDSSPEDRLWRIGASPAAASFRFVVQVSAPWGPGQLAETAWHVTYLPDSLPSESGGSLRSEPVWTLTTAGGTSAIDSSGATDDCPVGERCLVLASSTDALLRYSRADVLADAQDAYMAVQGRFDPQNSGKRPDIIFGFRDGQKLMVLGFNKTNWGFINAAADSFLHQVSDKLTEVDLRLERVASTGRVRVVTPASAPPGGGTVLLDVPYATLPDVESTPPADHFWFGHLRRATSGWTLIKYGVGTTSP